MNNKLAKFSLLEVDRRLGALFPGRSYANGGRVRDYFADHFHGTQTASKDFDYVLTGTTVAEAEAKLRTLGPVTLAGAIFPVFKTTIGDDTLDVALARKERSTGVGHRDFDVDFGIEVSVEDDQARRDFTMNMLSVDCVSGEVCGHPLALHDIEHKIIRATSEHTILEDPLRMLRAVQFASRLGFTIEEQTFAWIQTHAPLVSTMSAERHAEELNKLLLRSSRPSLGFELMRDAKLLPFILPELGEGIGCVQNIHHRWDVFNHNLSAVDNAAERGGDLIDRYAALLHDVGKPRTAAPRADGSGNTFYGHEDVGAEMIPEMFGRLRLAHDMTADVQSLVGNHMYATLGSDNMPLSDATIRRFIRNVSRRTDDRELARERIERQFTLRYCDRKGSGRDMTARQAENDAFEARVRSELAKEVAFTTAQLAVDGRDVIAAAVASRTRPAAYKGDRLVGQTLQKLLDIVLEMPDMNERSRLLDATNKIFAERDDDHQESRGR